MFEHRPSTRSVCIALAGAALLATAPPAEAQSWRSVRSARQLQNDRPVEVRVRFAAGELAISPADGPMLYDMELRYDEEHFRPLTEYDEKAGRLTLGVEGRKHDHIDLDDGQTAKIRLTRRVPVDLDLEFGAGEADLDLGGVPLRGLEVSTGASETTVRISEPNPVRAERVSFESGAAALEVIGLGNLGADEVRVQGGVGSTTLDFRGAWSRDLHTEVDMGIGSVTLRIPRDVGVRISRNSFLTSFDANGLVKRGGDHYSRNYDRAERKLTIDIGAALGSIDVEWID